MTSQTVYNTIVRYVRSIPLEIERTSDDCENKQNRIKHAERLQISSYIGKVQDNKSSK